MRKEGERMKRYSRWIWMLVISLFAIAGMARAQDADKSFKSDVSVGYHFIGHNDEMTKVGEYESLSSGAHADINFDAKLGEFLFGGHGFYYDESEKDWSGYMDFARIIRADYHYNSFIHRTRHDELFKDEDKTSSGATATNPFGWIWDGGQYELEGAQNAIHTDLDSGKDYQIFRTELHWDARIQIPFFPYVIPEIKIRREARHGWKQHTFMAGKCASCHVIGDSLRVDEETTDVSIGGTLKYGVITASYFHTESHFDNEARKNFYDFDGVAKGNDPTFRSRILYDNSRAPYGEVPDVDKDTDKVKLRVDLPYRTTLYGSFVTSRVENSYTDNDYDTDTYFSRLTTLLLNNRLTLTARFRYYDIDNEDVKVDLNEYNVVNIPEDASVAGPGYGGLPVDYWNYERKSALSREVTETGFDFRYRLAKGYTLRGGYTYKRVDRDEDEFKDYYDSILNDEDYLDDEATTYHIFKLALNARPFKTLNGRLAYEYYHADSPFQYHNAMCFDGWYNVNGLGADPSIDPALPTPTPYYLFFKSNYRSDDASNVPENHHNVKLSATWTPLSWLSANVVGQYTYEENDDADNSWENNSYEVGINLWVTPIRNFYVTLGYDYQRYKYEADYCVDLFAG
jgi:hypothetical protein